MEKPVLVIGGGISGITTAVEIAEVGHKVVLVEKLPYLGGKVIKFHKYFPKLCPPYCGLEINFKRIRENPRIKYFTSSVVEKISGDKGNYQVIIRQDAELVNQNCTACGACDDVCPVEIDNDYNYGIDKAKAINLPHELAFPLKFTIDKNACKKEACAKCVEVCKYNAIQLDTKPTKTELRAASVVFATGWEPYNANKLELMNFGKHPDIITNVMFERYTAPNGPTKGKLLKPSDGKPPGNIVFVQCAGSRDENHLPYCSAVCCSASLKHALIVREKCPEAKVRIYYIDLRVGGRNEDFLNKVKEDNGIELIKGKAGKIEIKNNDLFIIAEDIAAGKRIKTKTDLVVLATGIVPSKVETIINSNEGFLDQIAGGYIAAGCAKRPMDVSASLKDATAAALKAIQKMTEKKIETYICKGCDIDNCFDVQKLCDVISAESAPSVVQSEKMLCNSSALNSIQKDIKEKELDAVVIGACSHRFHNKTFSFGKAIITERVNLREQVAWTQEAGSEDTQMLAEDLIRMGLAKIKSILNPKPYIPDKTSKNILVLGGGISGITAAIEGAKAGYEVALIEKEEMLGGWSNNLFKQIPLNPPYQEPQERIISKKILELQQNKNIHTFLSCTIEKISGEPGDFNVEVKKNDDRMIMKVGAIVLATGWKPYDPKKLTHLSYDQSKDIISNVEFEKMAKDGNIRIPSSGNDPGNVVFVQCAGSRDKNHLPYCSNYCCGTSLKQAKYILDQFPEANVYIIYKDIRTPGHYEEFYKNLQSEDRLFLTKGEVKKISTISGLTVGIESELFRVDIQIDADLVVLAMGMTPSNSEDLNLTYRLGKGLPELKYDFPDSHFICFPYESRRTGIYASGTARAPMDIPSCIEDAGGAMLKAIQCVEATNRGESVHPRSGDKSWPELYLQRCTDCKRCTEECPFGSYDETESGTPLPNPARCRRCGICLGACPERIINFSNFSINSVSEMIRAVHVPDEFEEKPRILAFVCENDAYPAFDMAGLKRLKYSPFVRIIPVRCIGSINKVWISDALSQGFDGIIQIGCKPGDNYQCHYIHGSELTEKRGENIQETLDKMMLESERIKTVFLEINEYDKIPEIINDYVEEIELVGMNPFKGM